MSKLTPDGTVAAGTFADPAISGKRGPCLGDAPNSIFLGGQRNSEFDQGSGAVQRHPAVPDPRDQGPRNRARWRSAAARARAVASAGARPAHAPDVAPVLRLARKSVVKGKRGS